MDTIGKYKLIRIIGEGGMGRVYEAIDPIIGRRVAIKTISLNVAADAETRSRFFREAQAAGQLSHPNLITIHDIGEEQGTPYIVMEYLEGMDLNRKIRQERLSYDTKMQIMIEVCEGLAFAHGHDVVHRDIKPANIFITTQGRVKILDFGLARGALSDVTQTGKILGTPNYMSPEQIRGDDVDHRADIFSTGVVFYELLSGRKAFEGDSIATTIYKVLETQPRPLHQIDEHLPTTLSELIERALAKDRVARFQSSSEMLDAILQAHGRTTQLERSHLQTMPVPTAPIATTPATAVAAPSRFSAITAWIIAAAAVAGIAGFALWSRSTEDATPPQPVAQADPGPRPSAPPSTAAPAATPVPATPVQAAPVPALPAADVVPPAPDVSKATKPLPKVTIPVEKPARRPLPAPVPRTPAPVPDSRPAPAPPPVAVEPPPVVVPPPTQPTPPEPKPAPIQPPPPVVAPVVTPPPLPPPVAARAEENPVAAVQGVLAKYRAALESRDIGALKRIWPALSGRQEEALRSEFEHARAITVGLDGMDIRPTSSGATVTCRRNYTVMTADGQTLRTTTTMFMTLARRDGAWSIETIRHEVAR